MIVNPGTGQKAPGIIFIRERCVRDKIAVLGLLVVLSSGCGASIGVVKENLETISGKPFANAFTRALSFAKFSQPVTAEKTTEYPTLTVNDNDPRVRKFIREYAYNQRTGMKAYLERATRYLPMVKTAARQHGLPEDLAYLFLLESGANPEARSPANALGMWQFMPETARSYGLRVDSWVDERLDPEKSTKAAMLYLKDLYGKFGCWRLALSAYNSGENKMNRALSRENSEEYDEICTSRHLRKETREFFPRFLAIAYIAKNAGKYGFPPIKEAPEKTVYDIVPVEGSYSLARLARVMNVSPEELVDINPALVRGSTPPDGPAYALRVPAGKKQILAQALKALGPEPPQKHLIHVVKRGDNLTRICRHYKVDSSQIAHLNPDVNFRRRLTPSLKIVIPSSPTMRNVIRTNRGKRMSAL